MRWLSVSKSTAIIAICITLFASLLRAADVTGGLTLWLDASDAGTVGTSGSSVTTWLDKSPSGNDFSQASGALQPLYIGGVIRFDGIDDLLTSDTGAPVSSYFSATSEYTVVAVFQPLAFFAPEQPLAYSNNGGVLGNGYFGVYARGPASGASVLTLNFDDTNPSAHQISNPVDPLQFDGYMSWREDAGNTLTGKNFGDPLLSVRSSVGRIHPSAPALQVGKYQRVFEGDVAELRIYNRVLTPAERADVEDFLAAKWSTAAPAARDILPVTDGLTLSSDASATSTLFRDGLNVFAWGDKSGSGHFHFDNSDVNSRPLQTLAASPTGLDVLRFDGNSDRLTDTHAFFEDYLTPSGYTVFAVFRAQDVHQTGAPNWEFDPLLGGQGWWGLGLSGDAPNFNLVGQHGVASSIISVPIALDTYYVATWYFDGAFAHLSLNTGPSSSVATTIMPAWPFDNYLKTTIGHRQNSGTANTFFDGDIAELAVYNRTLDAAERDQVATYLEAKWISGTCTDCDDAQAAIFEALCTLPVPVSFAAYKTAITILIQDTVVGPICPGGPGDGSEGDCEDAILSAILTEAACAVWGVLLGP